jgi:hypothetical protein
MDDDQEYGPGKKSGKVVFHEALNRSIEIESTMSPVKKKKRRGMAAVPGREGIIRGGQGINNDLSLP